MAGSIQLKTTYVERQDPAQARIRYNQDLDTLYIHLDAFGGLHVAHYLADGVYALFDPETMQVVGFQVENWERVFLACIHPDLRDHWSTPTPAEEDKKPIVQVIAQYTPSHLFA